MTAKERCQLARIAVQRVDPQYGWLADKVWPRPLLAVDGQPAPTAEVMFKRIAIMLEILVDRRSWLKGRMR